MHLSGSQLEGDVFQDQDAIKRLGDMVKRQQRSRGRRALGRSALDHRRANLAATTAASSATPLKTSCTHPVSPSSASPVIPVKSRYEAMMVPQTLKRPFLMAVAPRNAPAKAGSRKFGAPDGSADPTVPASIRPARLMSAAEITNAPTFMAAVGIPER